MVAVKDVWAECSFQSQGDRRRIVFVAGDADKRTEINWRESKLSNGEDSLLSDLARLIPGYGAYLDQEARRKDDRLTREFLTRRLDDCKAKLDEFGRQAAADGNLELPLQLEKLRDRMDLAQRRLAAAVEGYAGWFGERKVDATVLEEVAKLDANLVSVVDQIDAAAKGLSGEREPQLGDLEELLTLLHQRIDRRTEIITAGAQ
jgi:hypothetical protein